MTDWTNDGVVVPSTGTLYDLLPLVSPYAAGVPLEVQKQQLRDAALDLVRQSAVGWEEVLALVTVAEQTDYALELDAGLDLGGVKLLDGILGTYAVLTDDTLRLDPAPAVSGVAFTVSVTVYPKENFVDYPATVLSRHGRAMAAGALARIFELPKYWNANAAARQWAKYHLGLFEAKREVTGGRLAQAITYQNPEAL